MENENNVTERRILPALDSANAPDISGSTVGSQADQKKLRIPLQIFTGYLDRFPVPIQKRATKAGTESRGTRTWGPEITANDRELNQIFEVAEGIYRTKKMDKNVKTFAYQLRSTAADLLGRKIENVRTYTRHPKPEPVQQAPAMASDHVEHVSVGFAMPPVANIERAGATIATALAILEDNGQSGVASLLRSAQSDIALPHGE